MTTPRYLLNIFDEQKKRGFRYYQDAIEFGLDTGKPFEVQMPATNLTVCKWQPGQDEVTFTEDFKLYETDQQKALQRVIR